MGKLGRTAGWANSVVQQSGLSRSQNSIMLIKPPNSVTQDKIDKRFSAYPKTTQLFQTDREVKVRSTTLAADRWKAKNIQQ